MLLQVVSDLHLEIGQQYSSFQLDAKAPYLILAGDVGRFQDYHGFLTFLQEQCRKFMKVIMVMGNHEFYGRSRSEGLETAERLQAESSLNGRFIILNRGRLDLSEDVTILGCTLQSHISAASRKIVATTVQDFSKIREWTVGDHNNEHAKDVAWLRNEITKIRETEKAAPSASRRKVVVVTHHAPCRSKTSRPEHEQNPWSDAFATDLLIAGQTDNPLMECDWWLFGHTHYSTYFQVGQVNVFSNQRGYVFPWQTHNAAPVQLPSKSKAQSLQQTISKCLAFPAHRKPSRYAKQTDHIYDDKTTIDV